MNTTVPDFVLIAAAVAPALALLFLLSFYPKSPLTWLAPRPLLSVLLALTAGVGSAFLALGVENLLTYKPWTIANLSVLALFALLVAGLAEEGAKYLAARLLLWPLAAFREPYDGILYCAAVGLGFGAAENISYVLEGGLQTALTRALTAVPFHCLLGVVLGWWLGKAKVRQLAGERWAGLHLSGLVWAVAAHGLYDFFAFQSGLVSVVLLFGLLAGLGVWGVWAIRSSRGLSPGWGGVEAGPAERFVPGPVRETQPVVAGVLGVVPGLGQLYNGELSKGIFLLGVASLNLFLLGGLAWLTTDPQTALAALQVFGGVSLSVKPERLVAELSVSPVLIILAGANVLLVGFSAVDAYRTSKSRRFDYLVPPETRDRFVQHFCGSYLGHVLALVLVVLVPVLAAGGAAGERGEADSTTRAAGGSQFSFDLVDSPGKIDGFSQQPEGTSDGKAKTNQKEATANPSRENGIGNRRRRAAERAKGIVRSYNQYLSYRFHSSPLSELFFEQLGAGQYTVLEYRVNTDGSVTDITVLTEYTTTSAEVSELALETVRSFDPALPLPGGVQSIKVIELFWNGARVGEPGSLEYELSGKPDGRKLTVEK